MLSTVYRDPEERSRAMSVAFSGLTFGLIGQHLIIIKLLLGLIVKFKDFYLEFPQGFFSIYHIKMY